MPVDAVKTVKPSGDQRSRDELALDPIVVDDQDGLPLPDIAAHAILSRRGDARP